MSHQDTKTLAIHEAIALCYQGWRLIARVESNDPIGKRAGPYVSSNIIQYALEDVLSNPWECSDRHPSPSMDAGLADKWFDMQDKGLTDDYLFGFSKLSQYLNWFMCPNGRARIADMAVLAVYAVPESACECGQFQAVMHREHRYHVLDLSTEVDPSRLDPKTEALLLAGGILCQ